MHILHGNTHVCEMLYLKGDIAIHTLEFYGGSSFMS